MRNTKLSKKEASNWALAATAASVGVALILTLSKAFAWIETDSAAVLGSFADSLLDLVTSIVAFIGVRMSSQPPDGNHRFGHDKAEAISSLVQLVLISASAIFVLIESIRHLFNPVPIGHPAIALWVMGLSIVLTILLISFQTISIRKSGSVATESDRAHYLGDVLGNTGTLLAVLIATQFGVLWVDGVAGLVAAGFLLWSVFEISRRALPQLMDEELSDEERDQIIAIVKQDPDVLGMHALRTRSAGNTIYIQLHLELDPELPLKKSHRISDRVELSLRKVYPHADIILHQDPFGLIEQHDFYKEPEVETHI